MPPAIWMRLEPYARDETLAGGLRAEVHDPLWLLARQWQLGEFHGEDVGSPVHAQLGLECTRVTRYLPQGVPESWYQDGRIRADAAVLGRVLLAAGDEGLRTPPPLEPLVERERIREEGAFQPRLAAEAGLHFLRLLSAHGAAARRAAVLARFPLQEPVGALQPSLDGDTRRFLSVVAGRVPDGGLLYSVLRVAGGAPTSSLTEPYLSRVTAGVRSWQAWLQTLTSSDRTNVSAAATSWLSWHRRLFSEPEPAPDGPSWIADRMEYEVLTAAPTSDGEVVLAAPEYTGGHLDWYSFDLLGAGSLGAARSDMTLAEQQGLTGSAIPVPVSYRGMPAPRWWQFEDAYVDFGSVPAGPQELVRLLLLEFAVVYGNDWYVIPVVLPVGTLARTRWLIVSDTFGDRTLVRSARTVDAVTQPSSGLPVSPLPWDMFRLSPDRRPVAGPGRPLPDALFLPPSLGTSLHSAPLEEVLFLRDELANVAWAVERVVESAIGRPLNRAEAYFRSRGQQTGGTATATPEALVYRLATDIPDHWLPLMPVRPLAADPSIRLLRTRTPQGRVLAPEPLRLHEEEVPREGARVTRAFEYARWTDGQTYLWLGRRKRVGRGEGSSGLRYDVLEPANPAGV